jgi:hypothetical protein
MPQFISIMKISDRWNEFLSANFEPAGKYFLVSQPAARGVNSESKARTSCAAKIFQTASEQVHRHRWQTNGTATEVTIIMPITRGSRPPMRFTTNGAPRPVEIPERSRTGRAKGS